MSGNDRRPVSLYLHVPFCTVKCAYCDFNSYAGLEGAIPAWERAIQEELRRWAPVVAGRPVPTVFIGGGTPSLLEGSAIGRLLEAVRSQYALDIDAEVTLEANPESVREERLTAYRAAGVNRLSMGVQSLHEDELRFLDRLHDAEGARRAVRAARGAGFNNVNIDLIYGLPGQSMERWESTMEGALAMETEHLSCYALTVEEGTPLASRVAKGEVVEAEGDVVAEMAEWTEERLSRAGYRQYEISNYAKPGSESRHNLVYWGHGEYVAVGPGAHGFVDGVRYAVERSPSRYAEVMRDPRVLRQAQDARIQNLPSPAIVSQEVISAETAALDTVTLGLRLNEGVDAEALASRYPAQWGRFEAGLSWGATNGLVERVEGRVRLTRRGRRLANEVLVRLVEPSLV